MSQQDELARVLAEAELIAQHGGGVFSGRGRPVRTEESKEWKQEDVNIYDEEDVSLDIITFRSSEEDDFSFESTSRFGEYPTGKLQGMDVSNKNVGYFNSAKVFMNNQESKPI